MPGGDPRDPEVWLRPARHLILVEADLYVARQDLDVAGPKMLEGVERLRRRQLDVLRGGQVGVGSARVEDKPQPVVRAADEEDACRFANSMRLLQDAGPEQFTQ